MWECKNGKERIDLKLAFVFFWKRSWIMIVAALAGAAIGGFGYFIMNVLTAPEPIYQAYCEMYIDFVPGEDGKAKYYVFNEAGWAGLVKTDVILEVVEQNLDFPIEREALRESVSATIESDYRIVQITVSDQEAERAVAIANAMEPAFFAFGESMQEIEKVRVFTHATEAKRILIDNDTIRVSVLGAILAVIAAVLVLLVWILFDESVSMPCTLEERYHIRAAGSDSDFLVFRNELMMCLSILSKKYKDIAVMEVGYEESKEKQAKFIGEWLEDAKEEKIPFFRSITFLDEEPKNHTELIKEKDGIILLIPANVQNGKLIERYLKQIENQEGEVIALVLTNVDSMFMCWYYFGKKGIKGQRWAIR